MNERTRGQKYKFYAVRKGRRIGVYSTVEGYKSQITNYRGECTFKGFDNVLEALAFAYPNLLVMTGDSWHLDFEAHFRTVEGWEPTTGGCVDG